MIDLGQVAYEVYYLSCEGKSIRGEQLPCWAAQDPKIREHWRAAADGVKMYLENRGLDQSGYQEEVSEIPGEGTSSTP